jgi:type I restriction enzyme S subunit
MSSEEQWDIPSHWCWTTISQIGEVVSGGTPASKEPAYWGGDINWISPADLTGYSEKFIRKGNKSITREGLKKSSAKLMPAGSVHFSSRAPIGYVAISAEPISTNQGFKSLIPVPGVFNEYIYYYLKGSKQLAERKASGTTFLELSGKAFGLLPIPLPPLPEQRRIVAKIEELFSELDNGIAALKIAREQLKVYRQVVLKHAFEGELTAQWREDSGIDSSSWQEMTVGELAVLGPSNGRSVKDQPGGFPVLRLTALKDGKVDLSEFKEGAWAAEDANAYIVNDGDFLFSRGNGSKNLVGRGGLVVEPIKKVAFPDTIMRVRLDSEKIVPEYFSWVWESRLIRSQIEKSARTTAGIYKINQQHVKSFKLPVPPISEQKIIVSLLEGKLSVTDALLRETEMQLSKSETLRQSILRKAFSGKLVPQDPDDEPASELLDRIGEEEQNGKRTSRASAHRHGSGLQERT